MDKLHFAFFRNYIVTCNADGSIPLNARVAGMVMSTNDSEIALLEQLIAQANEYATEGN